MLQHFVDLENGDMFADHRVSEKEMVNSSYLTRVLYLHSRNNSFHMLLFLKANFAIL